MTIIYHHMSDKHKQEPMSVKESAEKLSKLDLPKPSDTIDHRIHNKAWRLATSIDAPLLKFDKLPSGRYRAVKNKINLRKNCFRAWAVAILNKWFIGETLLVFFLYTFIYHIFVSYFLSSILFVNNDTIKVHT